MYALKNGKVALEHLLVKQILAYIKFQLSVPLLFQLFQYDPKNLVGSQDIYLGIWLC